MYLKEINDYLVIMAGAASALFFMSVIYFPSKPRSPPSQSSKAIFKLSYIFFLVTQFEHIKSCMFLDPCANFILQTKKFKIEDDRKLNLMQGVYITLLQ